MLRCDQFPLELAAALVLVAGTLAFQGRVEARELETASILRAAARIESLSRSAEEDVMLIRADKTRRPARVYDYLFRNDRLVLSGQSTSVALRYRRQVGVKTYSGDRQNVVLIDTVPAPSLSGRFLDMVSRLSYWWSGGRRPVGRKFEARDPTAVRDEDAAKPLAPILADEQMISVDRATIVPVWRGNAVRLRIESGSVSEQRDSVVIGKRASRVMIGKEAVEFQLTLFGLDEKGLPLRIRRAALPTYPKWIARIHEPEEAALAKASWLLLDAPPAWRLEGASQIALLADESLAARTIWEAYLAENAR